MTGNSRRPDGAPYPYVVRCRVPDGRENEWCYDTWEQADQQRRGITEMFQSAGEAVVITVLTPFNPLRYEVEGTDPIPVSALTNQDNNDRLATSRASVSLCPKNGCHALPDNVQSLIIEDGGDIAEALAAAYDGCEYCKADLERRVADGDETLVLLMAAFWLCSYAQVRASQGLPPAICADELFPSIFLKDLDPITRRLLRRIVLEPVEAPGGQPAAQPGAHELADLIINVANDDERTALWHDAFNGAVGIVMMETFRL